MIRIKPKKCNFYAEKIELVFNPAKEREKYRINQDQNKPTIEHIKNGLRALAQEEKTVTQEFFTQDQDVVAVTKEVKAPQKHVRSQRISIDDINFDLCKALDEEMEQ